MALEWWEYYEINHNVKNLQKENAELKKEIEKLREEIEKLKRAQGGSKARSLFCWFRK
jgi:cell division protein FtsB